MFSNSAPSRMFRPSASTHMSGPQRATIQILDRMENKRQSSAARSIFFGLALFTGVFAFKASASPIAYKSNMAVDSLIALDSAKKSALPDSTLKANSLPLDSIVIRRPKKTAPLQASGTDSAITLPLSSSIPNVPAKSNPKAAILPVAIRQKITETDSSIIVRMKKGESMSIGLVQAANRYDTTLQLTRSIYKTLPRKPLDTLFDDIAKDNQIKNKDLVYPKESIEYGNQRIDEFIGMTPYGSTDTTSSDTRAGPSEPMTGANRQRAAPQLVSDTAAHPFKLLPPDTIVHTNILYRTAPAIQKGSPMDGIDLNEVLPAPAPSMPTPKTDKPGTLVSRSLLKLASALSNVRRAAASPPPRA